MPYTTICQRAEKRVAYGRAVKVEALQRCNIAAQLQAAGAQNQLYLKP